MATPKKPTNRKPTPNQQAYRKEVKRIQDFVRRAEKRGYKFTEPVIPPTPKRITKKQIEALKKTKPADLYAKTKYYDVILDKWVTGTEEQKLVRQRASKKRKKPFDVGPDTPPEVTDLILRYTEELLQNWQPLDEWDKWRKKVKTRDVNIAKSVLKGAINNLGRNQVAKNLEAHADRVKELLWYICYGNSDDKWDAIEMDLAEFRAILYGTKNTVAQAKKLAEDIDETGL